jgi:hypothetical protein
LVRGGRREAMQCQFSFRILNLDNYKFGGWCLGLAVLLRNSRVFVAVAGFRSHISVLISIEV